MAASKNIAVLSQPQDLLSSQHKILNNIYSSLLFASININILLSSPNPSESSEQIEENNGDLTASVRSLLGVEFDSCLTTRIE